MFFHRRCRPFQLWECINITGQTLANVQIAEEETDSWKCLWLIDLVRPKLEYAAAIWSPHLKLQIEKVQRTAARWTCRRWRNTSSVCKMLDKLEWPSLEARRDQSSLLLFHKIHCGAVLIEKDQYMTPAHSLKTTRSSRRAQYRRHQTYSDALKNSFFPRTIPHWNGLSPSMANTQSTEEFRALLI